MSYPRQSSVAVRLHDETNAALDALRAKAKAALRKIWMGTRSELRHVIFDAYQGAAPEGRWNLQAYRMSGAENMLMVRSRTILAQFHAISTAEMRRFFREARKMSALRHGWILDQLTPESRKVRMPQYANVREAGIIKKVTRVSWDQRWSEWVDSYHGALMTNIRMEAMNESLMADAMAEPDATKVSSPASGLENALFRIYEYETMAAISAGEDDIASLNDDLIEEEVWKTRGDAGVCDDCDANEGLTADEADGDVPLHPNCNCFWLMVPKSYAALLRSGDEEDQVLARLMQAKGTVPEAITIRDEDGNITAKALVDFHEWTREQEKVLGWL